MEENRLSLVVKESGLDTNEGQVLLDKFSSYEQIAKEWEIKAKAIVVTDESQVTEMKMAKEARKFLSDKRIAVEKARKELKEQSLRKGQAIDAIARFLTSLIEPIEKYLKEQEDFIEIKRKKEEEARRLEEERRLEDERVKKEEAERAEQERIRLENAKLKQEAEEKERQLQEERLKVEQEKRKLEEQNLKEKRELEEKSRIEREAVEAKLKSEREEKERIQRELENIIECPHCHNKLTKDGKKL